MHLNFSSLTVVFFLAAATWQQQCKLYFQRIHSVKGPCNIYLVLLQKIVLYVFLILLLFGYAFRFYAKQSLKSAFETAPADPTVDLNMQLQVARNF